VSCCYSASIRENDVTTESKEITERVIERSFPIVQLNPLSVRERNAFKPVYKMHKWFARRSSSIFRAILLGAALPAEQDGKPVDLMGEFYKGHGEDPRLRRRDGKPLRVLDPFMGGGTTVVEALRLGLDVTGVDYNPIAWFIVRGETTPVDLKALDAAYQRVADKVRDELLALYKTKCPLTGKDADIIYGFWVKQGVCVDPLCKEVTDLFKSYVVGRIQGDLGLYYLPDVKCSHCEGVFDWELERCTITAGGPQVLGAKAAGKTRPEGTAFAFGLTKDGVACPHCNEHVAASTLPASLKRTKKKILVQALIDPSTGAFFEVRGDIPEEVTAPGSGFTFKPEGGPVDGPGKFICRACGRKQAIVESADVRGKPLPFRFYAFYAHTPNIEENQSKAEEIGLPTNNGKWFGAVTPDDLARVKQAEAEMNQLRELLPLPTQEIPAGRNFRDLRRQGYRRWTDVYGSRQLLALGKLLRAIGEEPDPVLRDALLGAFQNTINYKSNLCRYHFTYNKIESTTSAHDYRNPTTTVENSVWGIGQGQGSFGNTVPKIAEGLEYIQSPDLPVEDGYVLAQDVPPKDWAARLFCQSATSLHSLAPKSMDFIVTDPPYAGSVQYAEMSDWSYVWLHHVLKDHYPDEFGSEITLKSQEIIEDNATKDSAFFFEQLTIAWQECHRVLVDDGLLVFTFHHKEGDRWTGLLRSLFDAGFYLVAAYPTHSEALNSIVIQATGGITYDIVHVCRKRLAEPLPIPWSKLRKDVLREARAQLAEIEAGKDVLPGPDIQMILLGKALKLFSQHYGQVLDADGRPMALDEAMERILVLVREVRGTSLPLPAALQEADSLSQIALLHLVGKGPWTKDDLHKELRGYAHDPDALTAAGLVRKMAEQKGKLEVVPPVERASKGKLSDKEEGPLVDKLHLLLAQVQGGKPVMPLLKRWPGQRTLLIEALTWLAKADPALADLAGLTQRQIEELGPETEAPPSEQLGLFGKTS
jgi:putative DNA methylase